MHVPTNEKLAIFVELLTLVVLGWMLYGLFGNAGASIAGIALAPTILCLAIIWIFFAVRLGAKLYLLSRGSLADPDVRRRPVADDPADVPGFDVDAAFARYMQGRDAATPLDGAENANGSPPAPPRPGGGFGRKSV